jgi:hypothetical protein
LRASSLLENRPIRVPEDRSREAESHPRKKPGNKPGQANHQSGASVILSFDIGIRMPHHTPTALRRWPANHTHQLNNVITSNSYNTKGRITCEAGL